MNYILGTMHSCKNSTCKTGFGRGSCKIRFNNFVFCVCLVGVKAKASYSSCVFFMLSQSIHTFKSWICVFLFFWDAWLKMELWREFLWRFVDRVHCEQVRTSMCSPWLWKACTVFSTTIQLHDKKFCEMHACFFLTSTSEIFMCTTDTHGSACPFRVWMSLQ